MDENSLANSGDKGFDPWSGKIPHTPEQLNTPLATTTEAHTPGACASQQEKPSGVNEKPKRCNEK